MAKRNALRKEKYGKAFFAAHRSFNEAWAAEYDTEVDPNDSLEWIIEAGTIVKNVEQPWMWDILNEQLGIIDLTYIKQWLATDEFRCPVFVGQVPVLPAEDNVINGMLVPKDHLAEIKTNDPKVKQAVLDAVEKQQGEQDALLEMTFTDSEDDVAGPPPQQVRDAIHASTRRADVAHKQKSVGPPTPGKQRNTETRSEKPRVPRICRDGLNCKFGAKCKFSHDCLPQNSRKSVHGQCHDYLKGKCKRIKCKFAHGEVIPLQQTSSAKPTMAQLAKGKMPRIARSSPSGHNSDSDDGAGVGDPSGGRKH